MEFLHGILTKRQSFFRNIYAQQSLMFEASVHVQTAMYLIALSIDWKSFTWIWKNQTFSFYSFCDILLKLTLGILSDKLS